MLFTRMRSETTLPRKSEEQTPRTSISEGARSYTVYESYDLMGSMTGKLAHTNRAHLDELVSELNLKYEQC